MIPGVRLIAQDHMPEGSCVAMSGGRITYAGPISRLRDTSMVISDLHVSTADFEKLRRRTVEVARRPTANPYAGGSW